MERQAILASDAPPMLRMVVDEAAVRRLVGGAEVIRGQIAHLLEISCKSNIEIQLLPYSAGVGYDGSFVILDFPALPAPYPDATDDSMVYVDTLTGALYMDHDREVSAYRAAHEQLQAQALGAVATRETLHKIAEELAM